MDEIELIRYSFGYTNDGNIYWKNPPKGKERYKNKIAGTKRPDGYLQVRLNNKFYLNHRIVWVLHKGDWPEQFIDHINGIKDDNRIHNLREADGSLNARNTYKHRNGRLIGTTYSNQSNRRNRWIANYWDKNSQKAIFCGYYKTEKEAHEAYLDFERKFNSMDVGVDIDSDRVEYNDLRGGK